MDRRLLDYLPPVLRKVLEFQTINGANEPEISLAWDAAVLLLANQFLETADENGVAVWERELKIFPQDTDTLDIRKARIKAVWNLGRTYTVAWLKNWLTGICGSDGHEESITDYTIDVQLDYSALAASDKTADEILQMLRTACPCNMQIFVTAASTAEAPSYWAAGCAGQEFSESAATELY